MSEEMPIQVTGTMGAEEEATSAVGTTIAQIITLIRNIVNYALEYIRKIITWSGEHPLAATLFTINFILWVS